MPGRVGVDLSEITRKYFYDRMWWNLFGRQSAWSDQGLTPWPTELP